MNRIIIFCLILIFCSTSSSYSQPQESVMIPGMRICAQKSTGSICVEALDDYNRKISWDGISKEIEMIPRKERWYGALGLLSRSGASWENHQGVTRANVREAQLHFASMEKFIQWRKKYFDPNIDVYRNDGLLLSWFKSIRSDKKQGVLDLGIWQIMLNGELPTNLTGSNDDNITVEFSPK